MAVFGRAGAEAVLKRLQSDPLMSPREVGEALDSLRLAVGFAVEQHPWLFSHPQRKIREFALSQLRGTPPKAFVDAVARDIAAKNPDARREMMVVLARIAPERITTLITQWMNAREPVERESAIELIAQSPDPKIHLGHLKAGLRDPVAKIRMRAVRILATQAADPTVVLILRDLMHDEDDTLRHIVIEALAQNPTTDIVEPFFHRIALESIETRSVMMRALRQLAKTADRAVEKELMPLLADEDEGVREIAMKLLGELPDQRRVLRSFLVHLAGLAYWLRERSIGSIASVSKDLIPALVDLIADPERDVRLGAMQMARSLDDHRLVPPLSALFLSQEDWWERSVAAEMLGNFPSPEVTATLLERIDDPELRYSVIPILGKMGTPAALEALVGCLDDPSRSIRTNAIRALGEIDSAAAVQAVERAGIAESDHTVRTVAAEVLRKLGVADPMLLERLERGEECTSSAAAAPIEFEMVNDSLNKGR